MSTKCTSFYVTIDFNLFWKFLCIYASPVIKRCDSNFKFRVFVEEKIILRNAYFEQSIMLFGFILLISIRTESLPVKIQIIWNQIFIPFYLLPADYHSSELIVLSAIIYLRFVFNRASAYIFPLTFYNLIGPFSASLIYTSLVLLASN